MTAVTTVTGIGTRVGPATYSYAPRPATQRVRRLSPSTYWRRRLSIATLVLAVVVVAGKAGVALGDSSPLAVFERRPTILTNAPGRVIVVRPGDTLWSIAVRLHPGDDPRPLVDDLSASRHGAPLVPGESIRVPR